MYCVVNLLYEVFAFLLAYCWGISDLGPRRYIVGLLGSGAGLVISCMGGGVPDRGSGSRSLVYPLF